VLIFPSSNQALIFANLKQEEIVNIGYKNLVFSAFKRPVPEPITDKGPMDPLASYNLAVGGKVLEVTNDLFARAENLLSDHLPKFDPELFGKQGKVMDSWETVRHNLRGEDHLIFELKKPSSIKYVLLSTKYHTGNHSPKVRLDGELNGSWQEILPVTDLTGHSEMRVKLNTETPVFSKIKVTMYPDGGFTRLGLYHEVPAEIIESFDGICRPYEEKVPASKKPLSIPYVNVANEINKNWSTIPKGAEFNNASSALGAKVLKATDEHYSPAALVLSPFAPINMFDGMESARSRKPGHFEEVVIQLAKTSPISKVEMDFTYFVNNNPLEVELEGFINSKWIPLIPRTNVKAFAGNKKSFLIKETTPVEQLRVKTIPDGGINRLKVISRNL